MGRPLTEAQEAYARSGTVGMSKNAMRQAQQIASQRRFVYDRLPVKCEQCGGPRDARRHPICDDCTSRRKAGLR
jgi:hypothetical protein